MVVEISYQRGLVTTHSRHSVVPVDYIKALGKQGFEVNVNGQLVTVKNNRCRLNGKVTTWNELLKSLEQKS